MSKVIRLSPETCNHWTHKDEEMYLMHVKKNHGKKQGNYIIDARKILETWLKTYKVRKWNFDNANLLKDIAQKYLLEISAENS